MAEDRLTLERLEHITGSIDDDAAAAIIATGATAAEVEEAVQYLFGQDDVMGEMRLALTGRAAEVYEILASEEAADEDR